MKLLEEKGLRNKIINECIKYENELQEYAKWNFEEEKNSISIFEKQRHLTIVDNVNYAIDTIKELRMRLLVLLNNEKILNEFLQGSSEKEAKGILKDLLDNEKVE